jgi:hypothetical protein
MKMPTDDLSRLVHELRHAPTQTTPIEVVERVQHVIVRLEGIVASREAPPNLDAIVADAQQLIELCAGHKRR